MITLTLEELDEQPVPEGYEAVQIAFGFDCDGDFRALDKFYYHTGDLETVVSYMTVYVKKQEQQPEKIENYFYIDDKTKSIHHYYGHSVQKTTALDVEQTGQAINTYDDYSVFSLDPPIPSIAESLSDALLTGALRKTPKSIFDRD